MINFEKITDYDEGIDLKVQNHQYFYVESIEECLEEARYYDGWNAYKIYDNEEMIAFGMYGQFPEEENKVYLDRFFIDENYQGKGYFAKIMPKLLEKISKEYNTSEIYTVVFVDNKQGYELAQKIGFKDTEKTDVNGEKILCYKF